MKLSELKQGMVCELRGGGNITIINDNRFIDDGDYDSKSYTHYYLDGLTHNWYRENDIMKVRYGDKVVWERKESTFWTPEFKEKYYLPDHFCDILKCTNDHDPLDINTFKTTLVFKTKEEAEKQLLKQQATIRVIKEIARLNEGWKPNWDDYSEHKHYIATFFDDGVWKLWTNYTPCFKTLDNNLYLKSEELAKQLIETHEQDLKLMLEVE